MYYHNVFKAKDDLYLEIDLELVNNNFFLLIVDIFTVTSLPIYLKNKIKLISVLFKFYYSLQYSANKEPLNGHWIAFYTSALVH